MSRAARTIFYFGIYVLFTGLTLFAVPGLLLSLFGENRLDAIWIRVLGLVTAVLGYYYVQAARHELTPFFQASVQARPVVFVVFAILVLLGAGKPYLIIFGLGDILGAVWTGLALRESIVQTQHAR